MWISLLISIATAILPAILKEILALITKAPATSHAALLGEVAEAVAAYRATGSRGPLEALLEKLRAAAA